MNSFNETTAMQSMAGESLTFEKIYPLPDCVPCLPCEEPWEPPCDNIGCLVIHDEPLLELPSDVVL